MTTKPRTNRLRLVEYLTDSSALLRCRNCSYEVVAECQDNGRLAVGIWQCPRCKERKAAKISKKDGRSEITI